MGARAVIFSWKIKRKKNGHPDFFRLEYSVVLTELTFFD